MKNLKECAGRSFTAKINGTHTSGKIQVEDDTVYLCQNSENGDDCDDKLGYSYSWNVQSGDNYHLNNADVDDFVLEVPSEFRGWVVGAFLKNTSSGKTMHKIIFTSGEYVVMSSNDKAGPNYTQTELKNLGYTLVEAPIVEPMIEMTLEEIAKLKGVDVSRLRIKE